jgi:LysR family transcriptional regulator for metE and metH
MNWFHDQQVELRHLRLVHLIAKEGTLARVAPLIHLTQSALSHQLRVLEERLGLQLFVRSRRRMEPTPAGKRLLLSAEAVFEVMECAGRDLMAMRGGPSALLRVSTECTTCYHWLPGVLSTLQKKYPAVEVEINIDATRRPFEALVSGELDAAIVYSTRSDRRFLLRDLFKDELVVIASPRHRLATRKFIEPLDLSSEVILYYGGVDDISTLAAQILAPAGVRPKKLIKVPLTEAIIEMVKAGHGISMIPNWSALPHVQSGDLVVLKMKRRSVHRNWRLAFLREKEGFDYLIEFGNLLAAHSKPAKAWKATHGSAGNHRIISRDARRT